MYKDFFVVSAFTTPTRFHETVAKQTVKARLYFFDPVSLFRCLIWIKLLVLISVN